MHRATPFLLILAAFGLLSSPVLLAQEEVPALSDLVDVRASAGELELQSRGYEFVRTEKTDTSSYSYWIGPTRGRCILIRTEEGRYASIVFAPNSDCETKGAEHAKKKGSERSQKAADDGEANFDTVCGVETGGQTYRYQCHLKNENCTTGGPCRTHLAFPDNKLRITWHQGGEIEVQAQGVDPERTTVTEQDGQTRFEFGGKTYFVYRVEERAKRELAKLSKN